ncbi:MAG: HEPN domain-containing protein [Paludibacteraceae bacterium]|nr:HEPN domain-containing protein [Paludibacteraceae bacterium]
MSLSDEERRIMVELEIERAEKITEQFPTLQEQKYWDTLVNRMYYAVFHAVSALMIHNAIHVHTHRGALIAFNKEFVRTGVFSEEEGHLFSKLEGMRERGDYNCFIDTTEEEIVPLIEPLKALIAKIKDKISQ